MCLEEQNVRVCASVCQEPVEEMSLQLKSIRPDILRSVTQWPPTLWTSYQTLQPHMKRDDDNGETTSKSPDLGSLQSHGNARRDFALVCGQNDNLLLILQ